MTQISPTKIEGKSIRRGDDLLYGCPGCKTAHGFAIHDVPVAGVKAWGFNGNTDAPTLSPSVKIQMGIHEDRTTDFDFVCHHFVRDGRIEYCSDCTHALAGKTVDLPIVEWEEGRGTGFKEA